MWYQPLLSHVWKFSQYCLFRQGLWEYTRKSYTTFAGVLPQKWYSVSGSPPLLKKLLREQQIKIVQWVWSWHDIMIFIYYSHWTLWDPS